MAASAAPSRAAHGAAVAEVGELLRQLGGDGTDAYVEVLKPAGWRDRRRNRDALVVPSVGQSGPVFVIKEVLKAYRVPHAIIWHPGEGLPQTRDVLVVPDGRTWQTTWGGASNTWQARASSARSFDGMGTEVLERIAADLRRRLP